MNIVVLSGSPRRGANTDTMVEAFAETAREGAIRSRSSVLPARKSVVAWGVSIASPTRALACRRMTWST